jgi:hypothetical protein
VSFRTGRAGECLGPAVFSATDGRLVTQVLMPVSQMLSMASHIHTSFDEPGGPPPGSPPTCMFLPSVGFLCRLIHSSVKYQGPWLSTQIMLSSSIGMTAFLIFSYCRTRWPLLFAPRTQLKGTNLWVVVTEQPITTLSLQDFRPMKRTPMVLSLDGFFPL